MNTDLINSKPAYLKLCPELKEHNGTLLVKVDQALLEKFCARYDYNVVLVELLNQFAVRCVRARFGVEHQERRYLPASLRQLAMINPRHICCLFAQANLEPNGGTVDVSFSTQHIDAPRPLCSLTVIAAGPQSGAGDNWGNQR